MNKAMIKRTKYPAFKYSVQIITNGYYCGSGKFCRSIAECLSVCREYAVPLYGIRIA